VRFARAAGRDEAAWNRGALRVQDLGQALILPPSFFELINLDKCESRFCEFIIDRCRLSDTANIKGKDSIPVTPRIYC
jgi:hypothetical protein